MDYAKLIREIDAEIAALQQARQMLAGSKVKTQSKGKAPVRKKRQLSPEARAKIAAAQKRRWAKVRKEEK